MESKNKLEEENKALKNLIAEILCIDMGIYPRAILDEKSKYFYKERDGFKNGWNQAVIEYFSKIAALTETEDWVEYDWKCEYERLFDNLYEAIDLYINCSEEDKEKYLHNVKVRMMGY